MYELVMPKDGPESEVIQLELIPGRYNDANTSREDFFMEVASLEGFDELDYRARRMRPQEVKDIIKADEKLVREEKRTRLWKSVIDSSLRNISGDSAYDNVSMMIQANSKRI